MRRMALIGMAVLLGSLGSSLLASSDEEIRTTEQAWAAAVVANDFAKVEALLGSGLIYAHSSGVVETKDEYLAKLRSGNQKYDAIEHQKMTVKMYGDTAVVHSHVRMAGSTKGQPFDNQLMMLHVWVKQGGRWQLAAHQTTRLP